MTKTKQEVYNSVKETVNEFVKDFELDENPINEDSVIFNLLSNEYQLTCTFFDFVSDEFEVSLSEISDRVNDITITEFVDNLMKKLSEKN